MSIISGIRRKLGWRHYGKDNKTATVEDIDSSSNGALSVATYPGNLQDVRVDTATTPGVVYVGSAYLEAASDDEVWEITRVDQRNSVTVIGHAVKSDEENPDKRYGFNFAWDDRATLTYSN